jgi:hypothetical protein
MLSSFIRRRAHESVAAWVLERLASTPRARSAVGCGGVPIATADVGWRLGEEIPSTLVNTSSAVKRDAEVQS